MPNILASKECGVAPLYDTTSNTYQMLINGKTQPLSPGFVDVQSLGNWVLIASIPCSASIPSGTFSVSGYSRLRVESEATSCSGITYVIFNSDVTSGHYILQQTVAANSSITTSKLSTPPGCRVLDNWSTPVNSVFEFDLLTKQGHGYLNATSTSGAGQVIATYDFTAITAAISTIGINSSATNTGTINIYGWQAIKPTTLASYELVAELSLNNQILNDGSSGSIDGRILNIDGDVDEDWFITTEFYNSSATLTPKFYIALNNDRTGTNYVQGYVQQHHATAIGNVYSSSSLAGFYADAISPTTTSMSRSILNLHSRTSQRKFLSDVIKGVNAVTTGLSGRGYWSGGTTKITSLYLYTDAAVTGVLRIYKLAKTALISSNPNLLTTWIKSTDSNTIQVQPGEIEINGVICQVSSPVTITLSGNLKSGLTEAASTYYYLYAIKGTGRGVSYVFDTQQPLMDRYGNLLSSFDDCDMTKAWFHPTLGLNYRYIGQVYNDASLNIIQFSKMKPGYWESPWNSFSGAFSVAHALGKIPKNINTLFSSSSTGSPTFKARTYYYATNTYGSCPGDSISNTSVPFLVGAGGGIFNGSTWSTSGYYKCVLTD